MDSCKFRKYGAELIEWASRYMRSLEERKPLPYVEPGFLSQVVSSRPPVKAETFEQIMKEIGPIVLCGMTHPQHPQFFAYLPSGNAWTSVLGNILSNATGVNGTNWSSCPVLTELEIFVCDWCVHFLGLPKFFHSNYLCPKSEGAGIIQASSSDAIFYSLIWAREDAMKQLRQQFPTTPRTCLLNMLVAYCNHECHACLQRCAQLGAIRLRKLEPNNNGSISKATFLKAIEEDVENGLVPFFHCATIGSPTTTTCDNLLEVGPICEEYGIWLHVDAGYAGSCFANLEQRHLMAGYEYAWSTNISASKWMLCNSDATLHWVRYSAKAIDPMSGWDEDVWKVLPVPDLRHFAIPATRRFRAFKLWFTIRNYGVEGLRRYTRNHINLAKLFEKYVRRDKRFEVCGKVRFGLCAFRLRGPNSMTTALLDALNFSRRIHMSPCHWQDKTVIRFVVGSQFAREEDIDKAWRTIDEYASVVIRQYETDHAGDAAMQNLYKYQHAHDEIQNANKDPIIEKEETEALQKLEEFQLLDQDGIIKGIDLVALNGVWDKVNPDTLQKFDAFLQSNPDATGDNVYHDPSFVSKVQSMLHLEILEETAANVEKAHPAQE